jgi:hypothetical protein
MTLIAFQSHVRQAAVYLAAREAVLAHLREGDLPAPVPKRPPADLAVVEAHLEHLVDRLAEAFDPADR